MLLGKFGQRRPRHPSQQDIAALLEVLESFIKIRQSGTGGSEIGCVNLGRLPRQITFDPFPARVTIVLI
jgi:hypothetical protein